MQGKGVISVKLDRSHGDNDSVTIVSSTDTVRRPAPDLVDHELVIREARRRQHRRWLVVVLVLVFAAALGCFLAVNRTTQVPRTSASLLTRPLHFPAFGPARTCPASSGKTLDTKYFDGVALGSGPVRVLVGNRGDLLRGRVDVGATEVPGWSALETLWLSTPDYDGPFVVRAKHLDGRSPIEVKPGSTGLEPGSGPLVVPSGPTLNTFRDGYRTVPGSTWVSSPGCYAWQVDGRNFSEIIVIEARSSNGA